MTRTIDPNVLIDAIDIESGNNPLAGLPSIAPAHYGARSLTKTDALMQAAVLLAEQETKELRDAGYNISAVNPISNLGTVRKNSTHFLRIMRAIDTAAEEERFND